MNDSRCAEVRQYVGPYVDGEFDERDAALFEDHLRIVRVSGLLRRTDVDDERA